MQVSDKMHEIFEGLSSISAVVAIVVSIYALRYTKKNDSKAEVNKRLEEMEERIDENNRLIAEDKVILTSHHSEIEHLNGRVAKVEVLLKPEIQRLEDTMKQMQNQMQNQLLSLTEDMGTVKGQLTILIQKQS